MYKLKGITDILEKLAPKNLAYNWDNVGLQVGSSDSEISRILLCLDVNERVIGEAIEKKVQLIIAHHPLIFSPLKAIVKEDYKGNVIIEAIKNDINIYVAHTNIDGAEKGINSYIANLFNLNNIKVLDPLPTDKIFKISVFVPLGYEDAVANALSNEGAGHMGNYSHCTFRSTGEGTFMPLEGTNAFIGKINKLEKVKEIKIETIVPEKLLDKAIEAMIKAHPYEEVAYDIYELANTQIALDGIGRVGTLKEPIIFKDFIDKAKKIFNIPYIKVTGQLDNKIKKIAIVNGSGADYISMASKQQCDLLITGDVKYHDAQRAEELNINLLDVGHYESELFFINLINNYLTEQLNKENMEIEIINSKVDGNPFTII